MEPRLFLNVAEQESTEEAEADASVAENDDEKNSEQLFTGGTTTTTTTTTTATTTTTTEEDQDEDEDNEDDCLEPSFSLMQSSLQPNGDSLIRTADSDLLMEWNPIQMNCNENNNGENNPKNECPHPLDSTRNTPNNNKNKNTNCHRSLVPSSFVASSFSWPTIASQNERDGMCSGPTSSLPHQSQGSKSHKTKGKQSHPLHSHSLATTLRKPKRSLNHYNFFFQHHRKLILDALPPGTKFKGLATEIAQRWKVATFTEKQHFAALAAADKQRHLMEMKVWKQKQEQQQEQQDHPQVPLQQAIQEVQAQDKPLPSPPPPSSKPDLQAQQDLQGMVMKKQGETRKRSSTALTAAAASSSSWSDSSSHSPKVNVAAAAASVFSKNEAFTARGGSGNDNDDNVRMAALMMQQQEQEQPYTQMPADPAVWIGGLDEELSTSTSTSTTNKSNFQETLWFRILQAQTQKGPEDCHNFNHAPNHMTSGNKNADHDEWQHLVAPDQLQALAQKLGKQGVDTVVQLFR